MNRKACRADALNRSNGPAESAGDRRGPAAGPGTEAVDWNLLWRAERSKRTSKKRDADFWDNRAASFVKTVSGADYADQFLAIMNPDPRWSVLDMGCGSGVLALPLARVVSSVTAVDHSAEMLARVKERCASEGIGNVNAVLGRWEDDWRELGLGPYDITIASRSMVVDDLRDAVLKLHGAARKRVYVVTIVGDGPYDRRLFDAIGRPLNAGPDYKYNCNLLAQMGIHAQVAFIEERRSRAYAGPEEALSGVRWMFDDLTPEEESALRSHIEKQLVRRFGRWMLCYERIIRWAVICWEKG